MLVCTMVLPGTACQLGPTCVSRFSCTCRSDIASRRTVARIAGGSGLNLDSALPDSKVFAVASSGGTLWLWSVLMFCSSQQCLLFCRYNSLFRVLLPAYGLRHDVIFWQHCYLLFFSAPLSITISSACSAAASARSLSRDLLALISCTVFFCLLAAASGGGTLWL